MGVTLRKMQTSKGGHGCVNSAHSRRHEIQRSQRHCHMTNLAVSLSVSNVASAFPTRRHGRGRIMTAYLTNR